MKYITLIAFVLLIIGGLNWGFVGFLGIDLVAVMFGIMTPISRIIYELVGLSAVWVALGALRDKATPRNR